MDSSAYFVNSKVPEQIDQREGEGTVKFKGNRLNGKKRKTMQQLSTPIPIRAPPAPFHIHHCTDGGPIYIREKNILFSNVSPGRSVVHATTVHMCMKPASWVFSVFSRQVRNVSYKPRDQHLSHKIEMLCPKSHWATMVVLSRRRNF